jgi:hypothetical protein
MLGCPEADFANSWTPEALDPLRVFLVSTRKKEDTAEGGPRIKTHKDSNLLLQIEGASSMPSSPEDKEKI